MGLGTLINVICVIAGGLIGVAGRSLVTPAMRDGLLRACGISVVLVGISGAMQGLLSISNGSLTDGNDISEVGQTPSAPLRVFALPQRYRFHRYVTSH